MELVVDDLGKPWRLRSDDLSRVLDSTTLESTMRRSWIRGFVQIDINKNGILVGFQPHRVSRLAVVTTLAILARQKIEKILIWHGRGTFDYQCPAGRIEAIELIEELSAGGLPHPAKSVHYTATPRNLNEVFDIRRGRPAELLRIWNETGGRWNNDLFASLRDARIINDAIVTREIEAGRHFIEHWGPHRDLAGRQWTTIASGRHVQDHPVPDLGRVIAREFDQTTDPRLDQVSITIGKGRDAVTRENTRLLLPWLSEGDQRIVTMVSVTRRTIAPADERLHQGLSRRFSPAAPVEESGRYNGSPTGSGRFDRRGLREFPAGDKSSKDS